MTLFKENRQMIYTIFILALPVMAESLLQTLLGTVNMYFAGMLGDDAIAAISVVNLIMNIFITFYLAISVGITAIIGRYIGRNNYPAAGDVITHALILGSVIGFALGLLAMVLHYPILKLFGVEEAVMQYAVPYYMAVLVPSVFLCLSLVLSSCMRALGDTKTPMLAIGFANILNMLLSYLMIHAGFGTAGLGFTATLSRAVAVIILFVFLYKRQSCLQLHVRQWRPNRQIIRNIVRIGVPAGVEKAIMRVGQVVYGTMIVSLGTASFVAHNIAGTIESYAYNPSLGLGVAATVMVAVSLGEDDIEKAKKITHLVYAMAAVMMTAIGIIFFAFAPVFATWFSDTEEVQNLVVIVLRMIAFFQPVGALTHILTAAFQGAGDTKFPMYTTAIGIWGIRVGIGYVLAIVCGFGLVGVWAAYALDITVRGLLLLKRYRSGKWQKVAI